MKPQDEFAVIVAGIVQAGTFQLVNSGGAIVAELAPATVTIAGVVYDGAQLQLRHLDGLVTVDSALKWSQSAAAGTEAVELSGPSSATPPAVQLWRTPSYQRAQMVTGNVNGPRVVVDNSAAAAGGYFLSDVGGGGMHISSRGGGTLPPGGWIGLDSPPNYAGFTSTSTIRAALTQGQFTGGGGTYEDRATIEVNDRFVYATSRLVAGGPEYQVRLGEIYGIEGIYNNTGKSLGIVGNPQIRMAGGSVDPTTGVGLSIDAANVTRVGNNPNDGTKLSVLGNLYVSRVATGAGPFSWGAAQLIVEGAGALPNHAHIAFHNPGAIAYGIRVYSSFGRFDAIDTAGTAYVAYGGSAFLVVSSERFKNDVEALDDAPLLARVRRLEGRRWRPAPDAVPKRYEPSERLQRINALRARRRQRAIMPAEAPAEVTYSPADSSELTPERVGLVLEEVADVFPELVHVDESGRPEMLDIAQVAPLALAGVAALSREVAELRRQLAELSKN